VILFTVMSSLVITGVHCPPLHSLRCCIKEWLDITPESHTPAATAAAAAAAAAAAGVGIPAELQPLCRRSEGWLHPHQQGDAAAGDRQLLHTQLGESQAFTCNI
jgi:hypothetical protein